MTDKHREMARELMAAQRWRSAMVSPEWPGHFQFMAMQLIDSPLATTREFWRKKYFGACDQEACDPRPFAEVLAERGGGRDG